MAANPKDAAAWLNLGLLLRANGQKSAGDKDVLRAIPLDRASPTRRRQPGQPHTTPSSTAAGQRANHPDLTAGTFISLRARTGRREERPWAKTSPRSCSEQRKAAAAVHAAAAERRRRRTPAGPPAVADLVRQAGEQNIRAEPLVAVRILAAGPTAPACPAGW